MSPRQLSLAIGGAPTPQRMPLEPIVREASIEDNYRWTLRRAWGAGPCILWCGVNPSTADSKRDDPTMLREIGFSYRWGFGSLIKVNIYPFISSRQDALRSWRAGWPQKHWARPPFNWQLDKSPFGAYQQNIHTVRQLLPSCSQYMAAWGCGAEPHDLEDFFARVQCPVDTEEFGKIDVPITWHCLGKNADGSPIHTLARGKHRVPDDAKPIIWRKAT